MYAVHRSVDNRYLVRERDRRRTRELLAFALAALPPMAVLFAAIWSNLETVRLGYQIERISKQRETQVERNRQLQLERARSSALDRVESIATSQLGLAAPRPEQLILVQDGSFTPVPARPAGEPRLPDMIGPPAPLSTEEGF